MNDSVSSASACDANRSHPFEALALLHSGGHTFYYAPAEVAAQDPILQQTIGRVAADAFAAELVVPAAADKRNSRTLASHNPAACKAQRLGAYELHGTHLPDPGFFETEANGMAWGWCR